ncbi:hypothetical protein FB567DRAFT_570579 [Paraphoma chrysanthemicola]|uniref:Putative gamma-glutamylcyclotransferase n=1 Tax=Paraphoma chrysanthemicola TaxID=798071 RepID=A0A8K0R454_9PLEO|nr:hypothetical protein FB567DRAFT_570579 [Paraphoma chrysanthemicola]
MPMSPITPSLPPPPRIKPAPARLPTTLSSSRLSETIQSRINTLQTPPPPSQPQNPKPFHPCYLFFYGTLQDPDLLQHLLRAPSAPTLVPATLSGYEVKMWGMYPVLVPRSVSGSTKVDGVLWYCGKEEEFDRLAAYETSAYTWCECDCEVKVAGGRDFIKGVRVFIWGGVVGSSELEEGSFNFVRWKTYFKHSVIKQSECESGD